MNLIKDILESLTFEEILHEGPAKYCVKKCINNIKKKTKYYTN